ncbi:nicotinamide-nucleotide amidase [Altererythrobacter atlanticus]|uniref:Nicotinamide-nucleotide amidohydrolase PncC n=1 Tax=Croceibacterium atlanticum TaxID=1267766 RepID=A0A0F7KPT1_9SPHN|nr:nicotinamide-nucleotide amidohydrolase family protein [Croceibacterium atlanticum]AKH42533.1 Nicotinamide-nucleotide amidohydrolase PncC [Croceibacterium atlanticum]MBB5731310.1 nicotinamide-nucleotide amidase [Croceibacterium atlanticum]
MSRNRTIADLVDQLGEARCSDGPSLAVVESCTGGMFCSSLVANPDVSGALERGFVVYSNEAKCDLLGLDRAEVEACEGVSPELADKMAQAGLDRSRADISISITGFAGPQENDEEVGLVHIALAKRETAGERQTCHFGDIGRRAVCEESVAAALKLLLANIRRD